MVLARWLLRPRLLRRLPPLGEVRELLVLCTANRVRSPFAEGVLRQLLPAHVTVLSRGVLKGGGRCPGEAIEAAAAHNVDLAAHRARQVAPDELLRAQLVLPMELRMAHDLVTQYPALSRTVVPLGTFLPKGLLVPDIPDPYLLPPVEYEMAYDTIVSCCTHLAQRMVTAQGGK